MAVGSWRLALLQHHWGRDRCPQGAETGSRATGRVGEPREGLVRDIQAHQGPDEGKQSESPTWRFQEEITIAE